MPPTLPEGPVKLSYGVVPSRQLEELWDTAYAEFITEEESVPDCGGGRTQTS